MHPLAASIVSLLLLAPAADGWLGVYLSEEHDEAVVAEVIPDSPAAKAGLKEGDVLLAVGDTATATRDDFIAAIRAGKAGDRLTIKLRRGDKEQNVVVKLGERPQQGVPATPAPTAKPKEPQAPTEPKAPKAAKEPKAPKEKVEPPKPAVETVPGTAPTPPAVASAKRGYLGLSVRETDDGVVIDRVVADSPAKAAGVGSGDIVTSLGDHAVKSLADIDQFLQASKPGRKIALGLRNAEGARSVTITLGERPAAQSVVRSEGDVPVATIEVAPPHHEAPKPATAPAPTPAKATKKPAVAGEAIDLESELAALRAELADLRRQLEALRKDKGRE